MSFIERNKNWVLPLLGVAALGVIYMNVQMLKPKPAATPEPASAAATPPPAPAAATPPPAAPTAPASRPAPPPPEPAPAQAGTADLWTDLRMLEEPWAGLNQTAGILKQGGQALKPELLHPDPNRFARPPVTVRVAEPLPVGAPAADRPNVPSPPPQPPPEVDFLILNPKGTSAWLQGSAFQVGQILPGGWKVRRIGPDMVEVEGHGGLVRRWTNPLKNKITPRIPSPEAP